MAVKNIIFDMGQVLIDYCPERYTAAFLPGGQNTKDCELVTKILFGGEEWQKLDAGQITEADALSAMLPQLPEKLRAPARALFYGWQSYIRPIPQTNHLAALLKRSGYRLYILSNTGVRLHVYSHRIPAFGLINGAVYSADVQQIKPNADIFQTLLHRYSLNPEECFFIDDNADNVQAAAVLGIHTHQFDKDHYPALEEALKHAGVKW